MKGLTPRQQQILDYIKSFIDAHHYSPSYRELMDYFGFQSPGTMFKHIQTLKRKGVLTGDKRISRSIMPVQPLASLTRMNELQLPFIGNLSIGYPLELFMHPKTLAVPSSLVHDSENTYLLRVQGERLVEEGIQDNDLLIIEARQEIQAGEIILGLINQQDTVLKRYYPEGPYIRLESLTADHSSFTIRHGHMAIQGVLMSLLRIY